MARKFQMEIVAAMAHTQSLSLLPRTNHSAPYVELRQSLPSRVGVVYPFVDQLMRFILSFRMADGSEIDIEMALLEALANAVMQDWEKKSMPNTYDVTDEREAVGGEEGAAQQLNQILASGLLPLYRKAYRILGNTADAEDAVQDALPDAYTHLDQFRGQAQISTCLTS